MAVHFSDNAVYPAATPERPYCFFYDRGRMGLSFGRNIVARLCSVDKDD